jgi:hypothetical protein
MKCFRFMPIICVLALLSYTSLDAAPPKKRGVKIIPKSAPARVGLYNQSYAVIIGINTYEKLPSLEYAVKDARAVEEKLKALGFQTTILLDQDATKDNILKILSDELPRKVQNNDRVVIFFAGHSQTEDITGDRQMGFIVPVDADARNIFSTGISMDQIRVFSRRLQAKHVLYLIDSCFADLRIMKSGTIPFSDQYYLRKITTRKAHQMLTAGGKGEIVHLDKGGFSVFTVSILEALDGAADHDAKGFITFPDIAAYVKAKVKDFTKSGQIPQYGSIEGEGEFVFIPAGPSPQPVASSSTEQVRMQLAEDKKRLEEDKRRIAEEKAKRRDLLKTAMATPSETSRDGRFIAYDNGTVLDMRTNLMWAAKDNGANINWQDAKIYCKNYRGGGYTDWRMPTQDELAELYDKTIININPPADGCGGGYHLTNFIHLTCCCPWSAETRGSMAACFGFSNGPRYWLDQSYLGGIRVLPVRSVK